MRKSKYQIQKIEQSLVHNMVPAQPASTTSLLKRWHDYHLLQLQEPESEIM